MEPGCQPAAPVQPAGQGHRIRDRPAALDAGIGLLPWSPLGGGWLSGKYKRDQQPSGATRLGENPERGMEAWKARNGNPRTWEVIDAVEDIAAAHGVSPSQVALAWLADRPAVTSVILGARTTAQLADNLAAAELQLSAEEVDRLTAASQPAAAVYPYGPMAREQRSRKMEGGR
jgi:aryl-alcohol dehydrogenase (NADP+)